jgi:leucyl-tRNA synthetase
MTPYRKPREGEVLGVGKDGVLVSFEEVGELPEDQLSWRWARMSKSKGNVVTPEEAVESYGADALRMYLLFVAPFNADVQWSNEGMAGQVRFLSRIFKLVDDLRSHYEPGWRDVIPFEEMDGTARNIRRLTHQTIRRCTDDIDLFAFNTDVSWLMKYVNGLQEILGKGALEGRSQSLALSEALETLVLLMAPGAPHSADELWAGLGHQGFTLDVAWPAYDPTLAAEESVTIAVQVNGKLRDTFDAPASADNEELEMAAKALPKVQPHLEGKTVRKVIVVPGKLVNIVAA